MFAETYLIDRLQMEASLKNLCIAGRTYSLAIERLCPLMLLQASASCFELPTCTIILIWVGGSTDKSNRIHQICEPAVQVSNELYKIQAKFKLHCCWLELVATLLPTSQSKNSEWEDGSCDREARWQLLHSEEAPVEVTLYENFMWHRSTQLLTRLFQYHEKWPLVCKCLYSPC